MGNLRAGVQYNDFIGTAAADNADQHGLYSWAADNGLIDPDTEFVVGVKFYVGEHGFFSPHLLVRERANKDAIRQIDIDLSLDQILAHFKRFEVILVDKSVDIDKDHPGVDN